MAALVVMLGQAVGWVAIAQRDADRRQIALLEAGNVMEQITVESFDEINTELARKVRLSDDAQRLLGDDALSIEVQTLESKPPAKRITIAVGYDEPHDGQRSIRLTAWIYDRRG
jgi:hypothetical protein